MFMSCFCELRHLLFHINIPRVIDIVRPYWKLWSLGWILGGSQNNIAGGLK